MKQLLCAADARAGIRAVVIFALLCAATLSGPALAEPAGPATPSGNTPAENSPGLEEIVVTAEKRESTVQATPISITALSAEDLTTENVFTIEDLAGAVPGVSMRTAGPGQTEYEMRGLTSAGGSAATVGFYLDEIPLSASAVALNGRTVIDADLFDLGHVEVLRGPQGTLYGAGSMGGTIKLVPNPPDFKGYYGSAQTSLSGTEGGGFNYSAKAMVNLPIVADRIALRIVGDYTHNSGWIDRVVVPNFPPPNA